MPDESLSPSWLVIGYGNSLRRDDGAGLLLAEALATVMRGSGAHVRLLQVQQLVPELAEDVATPGLAGVVFVDAAPRRYPGDDVSVAALNSEHGSHTVTHEVAPELLLAMARRLYGLHAPVWLVTVGGTDFAHGDQVSSSAAATLYRAPEIWQKIAAAR